MDRIEEGSDVNIVERFGMLGVIVTKKSERLVASTETTSVMVTIVGKRDANSVEKSGTLVANFVGNAVMHGKIIETVHFAEQAGGTTTIEMVAVIIEHTAVIIK